MVAVVEVIRGSNSECVLKVETKESADEFELVTEDDSKMFHLGKQKGGMTLTEMGEPVEGRGKDQEIRCQVNAHINRHSDRHVGHRLDLRV
jgi:hypothetical protein